jgi:hypothetical protein
MADDGFTKLTKRLGAAILPHSESLETMFADGVIAILVENPSAESREALGVLGWDGQSAVFPLADRDRQNMATNSRALGDWVTHKWLTEPRQGGRLFVVMDGGTLLLNFDESGFSIEKNSTNGLGLT